VVNPQGTKPALGYEQEPQRLVPKQSVLTPQPEFTSTQTLLKGSPYQEHEAPQFSVGSIVVVLQSTVVLVVEVDGLPVVVEVVVVHSILGSSALSGSTQ